MAWTEEQRAEHAAKMRAGKERARQKREELAAKAAAADMAKEPEPSIEVAEGEPAEVEAPAVAEPANPEPEREPEDAFERWVTRLDDDLLSLGLDELHRIYTENERIAAEELRAERRKKAKERALHHAKAEAGLLPVSAIEDKIWQDRMASKERLRVELPLQGGLSGNTNEPVDSGLRIDGTIFLHDRVHTVTRAQADSMRDIMYRAKMGELDFMGQSRSHWLRRQVLSPDADL